MIALHTGFAYRRLNATFSITLDITEFVMGFILCINPQAPHPGVGMNISLAFVRINVAAYYCDHDHEEH